MKLNVRCIEITEFAADLAERASTTGYGHTILNPTTTSTSQSEAATSGAVKAANDNANSLIPTSLINKPNGVPGLDGVGKLLATAFHFLKCLERL